MQKILAIGLKDLKLSFRDRSALLLMLLAPFLLTLGFGFVSGAFDDTNDGNQGISDIPIAIINHDAGDMGNLLTDLFQSDNLDGLIMLDKTTDEDTARRMVDADELAVAIIIPAGFSAGLIPDAAGNFATADPLELYRGVNRPISANVIDAITSSFIDQVEAGVATNQIVIDTLLAQGKPEQIGATLTALQAEQSSLNAPDSLITLHQTVGEEESNSLNIFAFLAPGMALMFLMYTVTLGGRSILLEKQEGTLARMRTTPTSMAQILGGKIIGVFLSAVAQVSILIVASSLMLGVSWGSKSAIALLIISAAIAATGWGILLASALKTPAQVASVGSAMMILFSAISGTFVQLENPLVKTIGKISPNAWAMDSFIELGQGGTLTTILPNIAALWLMAAILFAIAIPLFTRQTD